MANQRDQVNRGGFNYYICRGREDRKSDNNFKWKGQAIQVEFSLTLRVTKRSDLNTYKPYKSCQTILVEIVII